MSDTPQRPPWIPRILQESPLSEKELELYELKMLPPSLTKRKGSL